MNARPDGAETPAQAARRALREARRTEAAERAEQAERAEPSREASASLASATELPAPAELTEPAAAPESAEPAEPTALTELTEPAAPRPGDVAREALRAARRGQAVRREPVADDDEDEGEDGKRAPDPLRTAASRTTPGSGATGQSAETVSELKRMAREGRRSTREPGEGAAHTAAGSPQDRPGQDEPDRQADTTAPPRPTTPPRTNSPSRAARSALAQAGAERRRAARDEPKPVRTSRRRRRLSEDPRQGPPQPTPTAPTATASPPATSPSADDLRRTFPAERKGPNGTVGEGSWWGSAWIDALEESALDPARLARGRDYAGHGRVDAVTVTPGRVLAYVHGSRPRPYRAKISLPTFTDEEWDRFLDAAAAQPGHIAALLDREMPRSLADCGVPLLPAPGELHPECSCPDSGRPCKHAAALCYRTARLLDEDPFVLLLLRGRGERGLLAELSRRNATLAARSGAASTAARMPGVRAREALAPRVLPPLPRPQPPLPHPEQPPAYPAAPGGPDPFALDQLATDAAARAHALLATGEDPVAELSLWQDAVRIAAARPGSGLTGTSRAQYESLAAAAGRTATDLARAVAAWRQGGREGLAVLEEPWDPPAGRFDQARPVLRAAEFPPFTPHRNRLTHPEGTLQLRLGRDGLWYAYESEPGRDDWWPRGTPDHDPIGALTALAGGEA